MKLKALITTALLSVFLVGGSAHAWSNYAHGYNKHPVRHHHRHKVKKVIKHIYVRPSMYHSHPANGLTNDLYHTHANGNRHHGHNYGTGGGHHQYRYVYKHRRHGHH